MQGKARMDSRTAETPHLPAWLRPCEAGVLISVHLQPGARRTALIGEHGVRLKIAVQAPPVEGRANAALLQWLAERLGLPRQQVDLVAGRHGRDKTVRADGIEAALAQRRLLRE